MLGEVLPWLARRLALDESATHVLQHDLP